MLYTHKSPNQTSFVLEQTAGKLEIPSFSGTTDAVNMLRVKIIVGQPSLRKSSPQSPWSIHRERQSKKPRGRSCIPFPIPLLYPFLRCQQDHVSDELDS